LREPPPLSLSQDLPISAVPHDTPRVPQGALVVPGRYTVRLDVDGKVEQSSLSVAMDPRVSITPQALLAQYALAHRITTMIDRTYERAMAAKKTGDAKAAKTFTTLNDELGFLLETVDGADAPPTRQATEAVQLLERRLAQSEVR
jgi:hypothetical protein